MPATERLYYSDSFLKTFSASVNAVRQVPGVDAEPAWQLSLDRTAFYPTSGGQPFDTGSMRAKSHDDVTLEVLVEQVEEDEDGAVWHFTRRPLAPGTQVEGLVDWERRFDHMQQHTGQHLLSAVFLAQLHAPTVSFHLGEGTSTIDLAGGPLAHHSLERVERIANEIVAEDRPVTMRYASREDAETMLAAGELRKLPDRPGAIRLIEIADCDRNACGGTHVRSTGQIGALLLRSVEKVSRGVRVEFVCGLRAVRAARTDAAILNQASALLSTGAAELSAAITRLLAEAKTSAKERQRLREELAAFQAAKLATDVPVENGLRLIVLAWKDKDRDFVRLLASRTAAAASSTAVVFCAEDADPVRVFVARSPDLNFNCGQMLREELARLGLRGGGSADLAEGDVPAQQEAALRASLIHAIRIAVA
ncbi:MAG: DHHA1 domain-containing protein [Terracidiphilus sp.]